MATRNSPTCPCAVCGKESTTHCAGCASSDDSTCHLSRTFYCSKNCQVDDWKTHKQSCQAAQAQIKLVRAGKLIQEVFLATRTEAFDLLLAKVERDQDSNIHIFDASTRGILARVVSLPAYDIKRAVLSYNAGSDILTCMLYKLSTEAFKGYAFKIEELTVRMLKARLLVRHHRYSNLSSAVTQTSHHVLRVTLRDQSAWAVDIAGAQHGQCRPVLPWDDYRRENVAEVVRRRPFAFDLDGLATSVDRRHPEGIDNMPFPDNMPVFLQLNENIDYQASALQEWTSNHDLGNLLKAKAAEFQSSKSRLVSLLATAARDYRKFQMQEPGSKLKMKVSSTTF